MRDKDIGAAAVVSVLQAHIEHAFDRLKPYHGKANSWGARSALISTVGMLRNRYATARCDSDGVSCCIRCQTMFLVQTMERLLASVDTLPEGGDAQLGSVRSKGSAARKAGDAR